MKLAIARQTEIDHIKTFLKECGWLKDELKHTELEDVDFSEFELLKDFNKKDASEFLFSVVNEIKALYHEKAMWNLEVLIDNCADKTLDHLDFNPEIKAGQKAIELLKEMNEFIVKSKTNSVGQFGEFHEKIKGLLSELPVAT
jgi:hypothetical protein